MPEISRFFGIVVRMFYDDHEPPHLHVEYQGNKAKIDFGGNALQGDLGSRTALRLAREWIDLHAAELMKDWDLAGAGRPHEKSGRWTKIIACGTCMKSLAFGTCGITCASLSSRTDRPVKSTLDPTSLRDRSSRRWRTSPFSNRCESRRDDFLAQRRRYCSGAHLRDDSHREDTDRAHAPSRVPTKDPRSLDSGV